MNQTIVRIFEIAKTINVSCVVAGGAAVSFEKASDIDVFVLGGWQPCIRLGRAIGNFNKTKTDTEATCDPLYEPVAGCTGGSIVLDAFYRAGKCTPTWSPKPIHITGFTGGDAWALLSTFDLSIHALAILPNGEEIGEGYWTPPGKPIIVRHLRSTTLARLQKLWSRYNTQPAHNL